MILLDTHVVVWWMEARQRISALAEREIAKADALLVSPVSCWEIATLTRLRRIALDREIYDWTLGLFEEERVELAAFTPQAAVGAGLLAPDRFPGDPADRFLYAQAQDLGVPFVTKDRRIRDYADAAKDVRIVW